MKNNINNETKDSGKMENESVKDRGARQKVNSENTYIHTHRHTHTLTHIDTIPRTRFFRYIYCVDVKSNGNYLS